MGNDARHPSKHQTVTRRDTRRRFEQWAKNPLCDANAISAVLGVAMGEVVEAEGGKRTAGQSPFALANGQPKATRVSPAGRSMGTLSPCLITSSFGLSR
jgi:hypothetical protein